MLPTLETIALELLEYKIEEFGATRTVRGGMESVWNLVALLNRDRDRLTSLERQLFQRLTESLAALSQKPASAGVPALSSLVLEAQAAVELAVEEAPRAAVADTPQEREEHAILQRLARRVWWDDLEEFVQRMAAAWRAEQGRATARLVFATLQNLNRNADRSTFGQDVQLRGFRILEPVPGLRDPLVSLSDLDALAEIVRQIVNLIMTIGKAGNPLPSLELPEAGAFGYVKQAAMTIAADPYAGRFAPGASGEVSSQQLKLAIQELVRERLPEEEKAKQRRVLESRLIEVAARERAERQQFQQDVASFKLQAETFFDRLADYLPTTVGGRASGPQLEGGVLFGSNPLLRWDRVPPDAHAVTIRMVGPVRLTLAGHDIAIAGVGGQRTLYLDGQELELSGTNVMRRNRTRVATYREGDYVHVRISNLEKSLAARIADALVAAYVLTGMQSEELLATLKVLANNVRGEAQEVVAQAITRASVVSARAPDRATAVEGLVRGSARAAGVGLLDGTVHGLVKRMLVTMEGEQQELDRVIDASGADAYDVQPLTTEPMSFDVGGLKLTVRQYRGRDDGVPESLVAMLPGQVLGSFTDYLITPRPEGTFLFARGEAEVAVLFLARAGASAEGAVQTLA